MELERCVRCCSKLGKLELNDAGAEIVSCSHCGFSEPLEVWQLFGWRCIKKYPPSFGGTIYVWGDGLGRKEAKWDSGTKTCSEISATHWLRIPDPRKQIQM